MEAELQNKSDNEIRLKKDENILRLKIVDEEGNDTGNSLEFNMEDIELPMRLQEMQERDKQNRQYLTNQFAIIDKKQDHKGKKLFSSNEEAKIKALQDFYRKEVEVLNLFLGENGVEKLLNGRQLSWGTLEEILDIITESILPKLKVNTENIKKKIMDKYSTTDSKRDDVIE